MGGWPAPHPGRFILGGRDRVVREAGLDVSESLAPTGVRTPDRTVGVSRQYIDCAILAAQYNRRRIPNVVSTVTRM